LQIELQGILSGFFAIGEKITLMVNALSTKPKNIRRLLVAEKQPEREWF